MLILKWSRTSFSLFLDATHRASVRTTEAVSWKHVATVEIQTTTVRLTDRYSTPAATIAANVVESAIAVED